MKTTLLAILLTGVLGAQRPERIYPNAREHKSIDYLKTQSEAWKKETQKDPRNADAWYNYYYANRNLGFNDTTRSRDQKQAVINNLLDEMAKAVPESYEYNLCRWMNGGWNMKLIGYLEKAQKAGPDRPEHLDYSIVLAEMRGDRAARDKWSQKKHEAGQLSSGLLYYNHNVLAGLPGNAILITSGDNDTFPLWYLQALGVRPDVTIVHASLVYIPEYRAGIFGRLGIADWPETEDGKSKPADLVSHVAGNSKALPVYLGLTAAHCLEKTAPENMYLTGLAYVYSKNPVDNMAHLRRNFERAYALDYIDKPFYNEISPGLVKSANGNYIVPMLKLLEHYRSAGEESKSAWISNKLASIVQGTEDEAEVRKRIAELN